MLIILAMHAHKLCNAHILFYSDNTSVVNAINNQSSKKKHMMSIVRPLVLLLLKHNIFLRSKHVAGVDNVLCDKISRFQVTEELLKQYGMKVDQEPIPAHLKPENFKFC